ncbi:MAG: hypothetical protein HZA90_18730 [Verrucomicrobia bacterium]|nr:hypothetical protein [Verrucomicrobiota bacterium]
MSEDGTPEGLVSRDEIAQLAALFDRFEFAFDPRATATKEAESDFDNLVTKLFEERVRAEHPEVSFTTFYCRIKTHCRIYLRKNAP